MRGPPTTSNVIYTDDELELLRAVLKSQSHLKRPLNIQRKSDLQLFFEIIKALGYRKDPNYLSLAS
jgi:hypothetical protein